MIKTDDNNSKQPTENIENNKEVSLSTSNIEDNIKVSESKRIDRIENWHNQGFLDDERKEKLIKSGKDFNEQELNSWIMEQDKEEYVLNQVQEQEKIKRIYDWLNNVKEPSTNTTPDIKSDSKPTSRWSSSSSEEEVNPISSINSNMDQIKEFFNSFEFFNDTNYLMIHEHFLIYICYLFVILICLLIICCIFGGKKYY